MADIEARIEAQHGPNCTCTRLEPISFQPVIAGPNCPGEPTRYAQIDLLPPHDPSAQNHTYPVQEPLSTPYSYGPCSCGRMFGESAKEAMARLAAAEAVGIRYSHETAKPVDQYGRAVEPGGHDDGPETGRS